MLIQHPVMCAYFCISANITYSIKEINGAASVFGIKSDILYRIENIFTKFVCGLGGVCIVTPITLTSEMVFIIGQLIGTP